MRTEIEFRRNANSNITVPWAVTRDSRGTVFGQPLGRNNCGCQGVPASPTVMKTLLRSCRQRSTPYFFQSCRKAHRVLDGRPEPLQQYQVTSLAVASESQPGKTTLCTKSERDENRSVGSPGSPIRTSQGRRYSPGSAVALSAVKRLDSRVAALKKLRMPESVHVTTLLNSRRRGQPMFLQNCGKNR